MTRRAQLRKSISRGGGGKKMITGERETRLEDTYKFFRGCGGLPGDLKGEGGYRLLSAVREKRKKK